MTDGFQFEGEPETTPHRDEWQEEIGRLAALPGIAYDREREATAARLGCRVGTLDKEVARVRGEAAEPGEGTPGAGRPLRFGPPELHPEPVDGAELLLELAATFRRFLALPKHADTACALWVVHTHAFAASPITPRLAITSPEKRCGKTTLLELVGALVAKPQMASNVSAAATFRTIELCRPTLLIDEADTFLGEAEELRGILNSGHRRSGEVIRVRERDGELEPVVFSTWAPVAIAMIGKLPGTLEDRAVQVAMRRRAQGETVERWRCDQFDRFAPLTRKAARWGSDHPTATILAELVKLEHRPWPEISNGKPMTPHKLAKLLGRFGVAPTRDRQERFYQRDGFEEAWSRYLLSGGSQTVTPSQTQQPCGFEAHSKPSQGANGNGTRDGLEEAQNPQKHSVCDAVTVSDPPSDRDGMKEWRF